MAQIVVPVATFATGASASVTQDSITGTPTAVTITPSASSGLDYTIVCNGVTQTGTAHAGSTASVIPVTATSALDLTLLSLTST